MTSHPPHLMAFLPSSTSADVLTSSTDFGDSKKVLTVVLTGGPCGGKSTALTKLKEILTPLDMDVYFATEAATLLFSNGARFYPDMTDEQIIAMQVSIMKTQIQLEEAFVRIAQAGTRTAVVVCDRGSLDCKAYVPRPEMWDKILEANGWTEAGLLRRYDVVVHLTTAADGAEKFYTTENNNVRSETPAEAVVLDQKIQQCWTGHPHMIVVPNKSGFEEKVKTAVNFILKKMGVPAPRNCAHRYLLKAPPSIPIPFSVSMLKQTYLKRSPGTSGTIRIQHSTTNQGQGTYSLSRLRVTSEGDAVVERVMTPREYDILTRQADQNRIPVEKRMHRFLYNKVYFTIVEYITPPWNNGGAIYVDYQTETPDEQVDLPDWLAEQMVDRTDNVINEQMYTSFNISAEAAGKSKNNRSSDLSIESVLLAGTCVGLLGAAAFAFSKQGNSN